MCEFFFSGLELLFFSACLRFFLFLRRNHGPKSLSPNFRAEKQIFSRASFSANFGATSEKKRLSSKPTEWTGLTFCLSSLTIYNPWQILQGGGLVTFQGELLHDSLSFYHMFSSLHLQNAGFAISSAEKRSIHRTEFDENDPISSL